MKTAILTKIALVLAALYLVCPDMSRAETPEYDITIGRTIHTDKPVCLVYRHDGFWVTGGVTEDTLRHYSTDGTLLAEYQLPGSVQRYGVAWDGAHWWIGDNNYGSETIYKCELNEAEKRLEPLRAYAWPYLGPSGLEWAQGYLWVSDDATDIIYRVSVGDTSFTAIEAWCSTNPEPWDLAWDGTNIWSITGPGGGFDPVHGEREIYKHDAAGNIIEIWHYPPADDPAAGSYGGCGTGLAFAGSQLWYCDYDKNQIIEAIRGPGDLKGRIAFVLGAEQRLYVMNADGSSRQQVPLPPLEVVSSPQWSRDGLWLTFCGGKGNNCQIYIVRPDGTGFRRVTNGSGDMVEPGFSPDGSQITFCGPDGTALYVINTDGTGLRRLPVDGSFPEWWPLGDRILYSNWGRTYESDLFLYDLTTGRSTQITHHAPGQTFIRAAWSPNGRRLAVDFRDRNRTGEKSDVLIMNADGSNPYNFTAAWPDSGEGAACWSPDGQFILFASDRTGNFDIWYSPVDVFSPVDITNSPGDEDTPAMGAIAEAQPVYYVDAVNGDDNNNGLSRRAAFATISKGVDSATIRCKVLVYPGVYQEEVDFKGKAITVQGVATKDGIPIIENPGDFAVSFYNGEGPRAILKNFVIRNSFMAVFIAGCSPTIENLNIIGNKYGIEAYAGSEPDISNCIFWENSDSDIFGCEARYSCTPEPGQGNIAADPCFVDPNNGDYHLLSQRGRYWPRPDVWVLDKVTSPCVDGGDPNDDVLDEPMPNGGRIDMGSFGGTPFASMSEIKWLDGDVNHDGIVNFIDLAMLAENWLATAERIPFYVPSGMVLISGGTFQMGDSFNEGGWVDELPVHTVTLDSFAMGKFEVTNQQYCEYLNSALDSGSIYVSGTVVYGSGNNHTYFNTSPDRSYSQIAYSEGIFIVRTKGGRDMSSDPVVCVSWFGAVAYWNWRSQKEGREICYNTSDPNWACDFNKHGYRLPTEAEWEYAARGGLAGKRFPWGDEIDYTQANYGYNPLWNDGIYPYTSPVGSFSANGFGLYDMAGNVWEWCNDWFGAYTSNPQTNPTGPTGPTSEEEYRVLRSGGWGYNACYCRVSYREYGAPHTCDSCHLGFRCAMNIN